MPPDHATKIVNVVILQGDDLDYLILVKRKETEEKIGKLVVLPL